MIPKPVLGLASPLTRRPRFPFRPRSDKWNRNPNEEPANVHTRSQT